MKVIEDQRILNFIKELSNDDACEGYLAGIKRSNSFTCIKCISIKRCKKSGHTYHYYGCNHVGAATANTLFIR